jgi:uncharacterized membrane-anchored protein
MIMILRLFTLLLLSTPVIFATLWFSDNPGQVSLDWLGWRVETNVPVFLVALLAVFVALFIVERGLAVTAGLPVKVRRTRRVKGLEKGLAALVDALDAAAAGDVDNGRRLGAEAARQLERPDLAARLDRLMPRPAPPALPDAAAVKPAEASRPAARSRQMPPLPPPSAGGMLSRLFGGRRHVPPRPFAEPPRPAVPPAAERTSATPQPQPQPQIQPSLPATPEPSATLDEAALAEKVRAGAWDEALSLAQGDIPAALRWRALILTAQADAEAAADPDRALALARQAVTADPAGRAAALLALRLAVAAGERRQAEAILAALWPHAPSLDYLHVVAPLWAGESASARAARLEALVRSNPQHPESHLAEGSAAVEAAQWGAARRHLVAAIKAAPDARAFRLMIAVEEQDGADAQAIEMWRRREAEALAVARWHCTACAAESRDWGAVCPACSAVGTLAWEWRRSAPPGIGDEIQGQAGQATDHGAVDADVLQVAADMAFQTVDQGVGAPAHDQIGDQRADELAAGHQ